MTAGPGNTGNNDYAATIAVSTNPAAGPSAALGSAINFPRAAVPAVGGIFINNPGPAQVDNTEFVLPAIGTYRVSWHISVDEPAQFALWVGVLPAPNAGDLFTPITVANGRPSQSGQATGTEIYNGDTTFQTLMAGSVIQVRNCMSAAALTVTPLPGGTQAQAAVLTIMRLA